MNPREQSPSFEPSATFVCRTPLLAFDELERWSRDLEAPNATADELAGALARDRAVLRRRLIALVGRNDVREALFLASPDLEAGVEQWVARPSDADAAKIERAVVRYFARMSSRPTPFGLFSGVSSGTIAHVTAIEVGPRAAYARHTRPDNEYLFECAAQLCSAPELVERLTYRPNSSHHVLAGRVQYAEAPRTGIDRTYRLVAVDHSPAVAVALSRSIAGATRADIAAAIVADDPELDPTEAREFVDELILADLLVPELAPTVTGPEPLSGLLERLCAAAPEHAGTATLSRLRDALAELDAAGLGAPPARYRELAGALEGLPEPRNVAEFVQVDLLAPCVATFGGPVLDEVIRGIEVLRGITPRNSALDEFRRQFLARYEERELPLAEVLDEDLGIGFPGGGGTSDASPLLRDLGLGDATSDTSGRWGQRERHLLSLLERAWSSGARAIELDAHDLARLAAPTPARLADAFAAVLQVAARDDDAVRRGEFAVLLESVGGPSGARFSGRFCHVSEAIHRGVQSHLRQEEALRPDAIFAEVAYLPEGRLGNVVCRPVLRDFEIAYLGESGAPEDRRLGIDDLLVSIRGDRVVLRSRRLGREVVARCSTAHNFATHGFGIYRFLCALQGQDGDWLGWAWGGFEGASFLPRISYGRCVFSRAQWHLDATGLSELGDGRPTEAAEARWFAAMQRVRRERGLPRYVHVVDGDNELLVDLDNVLSVEGLVHLLRTRRSCTLREAFPGPDELLARSSEGRFRHELVVPFVRHDAARTSAPIETSPHARVPRRFAPGSSWLYAKLYGGVAAADEVVRRVGALCRDAVAAGDAERWHFVRYADPRPHLRVRIGGAARLLHEVVQPALARSAEDAMDAGLLWRVQLDTYEREVERYGGGIGVELTEELFWHDAETAIEILGELRGEVGLDARWRIALLGIDRLFDDLGLAVGQRRSICEGAYAMLASEFAADQGTARRLAARFRREREAITGLLLQGSQGETAGITGDPMTSAVAALGRRSQRSAGVIAELHAREQRGQLTRRVVDMAWSWAHMHVNRVLRSSHRAHELVLNDFLRRAYDSRIARESGRSVPTSSRVPAAVG